MNPLKLKASTTPITSANFQGLQTMSNAEVKNYIANKITVGFAGAVGNGSNTADLNIDTANALSGTAIGTFVDTDRTEATGTHPATGAVNTVTYYAKQITAEDAGTITNRPLQYDAAIQQMTDAQIRNDIIDQAVTAMVTESEYTAGQYRLAGSAPSGGTWTSRYTITDVANGGNTTYYIWQKTAATTSPDADLRPLKTYSGNNVKQMTDTEIQEMIPYFRNRIISTSVGTYKIQASSPSPGTWVSMGSASDTREQVASVNYTGDYGGTRTYSNVGYAGSRTYTPAGYANTFAGTRTYTPVGYSGSRTYTGSYVTNFSGTRPFAGSRTYSASYTRFFGGFVGGTFAGSRTYANAGYVSAATNFAGAFAGNRTYSASYAGSRTYSGTYANSFAGSRTYTGAYAGSRTYTGTYSGTYAGDTIQATKDTVSTVSLWIRTA
jgi:hypothetical protein